MGLGCFLLIIVDDQEAMGWMEGEGGRMVSVL